MKCLTENFGRCSAHLDSYKKKKMKNLKLTAAHQNWGASQCSERTGLLYLDLIYTFLHILTKILVLKGNFIELLFEIKWFNIIMEII